MTTASSAPAIARAPVGGAAAWKGSAIDWRTDGLHVFNAQELAEIDAALRHLKSLGDLDLPSITIDAFPLDSTAATLADIGITPDQLPHIAELGLASGRLISIAPVPVTTELLLSILTHAHAGTLTERTAS